MLLNNASSAVFTSFSVDINIFRVNNFTFYKCTIVVRIGYWIYFIFSSYKWISRWRRRM